MSRERPDRERPLPILGTMVLFGVLGPLIGSLPIVIWATLFFADSPDPHVQGPGLQFVIVCFGYLLGGIPAALTGLAVALFSRRAGRKGPILLFSPAAGSALGLIVTLLATPFRGFGFAPASAIGLALGIAVFGAVVAIACTLAALGIRAARTRDDLSPAS